MASGSDKRLILNTREEVLSTNFNRLQAFAASDLGEILRALLAQGNYPGFIAAANVNGATEDHSATEAPLYGQVFSGLLCHPIDGTLNITIDSGVVMVVDPDAAPLPDDSVYKLVVDPGGSVTLTTNTSGQVRFDVVECSRSDVVSENDSRNQYDTSTGLFSPVSFDKVASGKLSYRVRAGTPGAGVPAGVSGWLPLLVVQLPNGTGVQLNACTFWDVRPLVSARYFGMSNCPKHFGHFQSCRGSAYISSSNLLFEAQGEVCDSWGYKLGGALQGLDSGGNIQTFVNLNDSANREGGYSLRPTPTSSSTSPLPSPRRPTALLFPSSARAGRGTDVSQGERFCRLSQVGSPLSLPKRRMRTVARR